MNESSEHGPDECYVCGRALGTEDNGWRGAASFTGTIDGEAARVCADDVDALDEDDD